MVKEGMDGVVALQSKISRIDGDEGNLEYRGYSIHDLAEHSTYEETTFLLWKGYLPDKDELEEFKGDLARRRRIPPEVIGLLSSLPDITHPMVVLRTAISYCGSMNEKLHEINDEENLEKSKDMLAMLPTIIAYTHRMREGEQLVHPREDLGHAANFLWMLKGEEPKETEVEALDTDLILHAEHTLNASTYSSRIAASTMSDMYAGIVAASGVLMGPLHGGAAQWVIENLRKMRDEMEEHEIDTGEWLRRQLQDGNRIPGFGHRVYNTMDPRAKELKELVEKLDRIEGNDWHRISHELEEALKEEKGLYPNVDFYAASVYANLGIPDDFFIPVFAMGRIAGWTAHMMEQYQENKLIRPLMEYVGEKNKEYVRIEDREEREL